jgi:6-phosphogluconolactonase
MRIEAKPGTLRLVALTCLTALCFALPLAQASTKVSKYFYVDGNGQIAVYAVNPDGGLRTIQVIGDPQANSAASYGTAGIFVSPSGKFVYTPSGASGNGLIAGYKVGTNGTLTQIAGSPFASTGAYVIAFTPNGKFAYGVNYVNTNGQPVDTIQEFSVNTTTGALTSIGTISSGGSAPCGFTVNSKGTFAYVTNCEGTTISLFSINTSSGALSLVANYTVPDSDEPTSALLSPSGKYLFSVNYASGNNNGSVSVFSVDTKTGVLTVVSNNPFPSDWGFNGGGATLDPSGQFLYVGSSALCCAGPGMLTGVEAFSVNETNGAVAPVGLYSAGSTPSGMTVDSNTGFLYVANFGGATATEPPIFVFSITPGTGALTETATYGVDGLPAALGAFVTGTATVAYTPTYAYATNAGVDSITELSIAGGGLTQLSGSPLSDSNGPQASAATPNNDFFYTGNTNGSISEYKIGKTGTLSKIKGSPITGFTDPVALVVDSYYNWIWITDSGAGMIDVYTINSTTGVLTFSSSGADSNNPKGAAFDPFGQFVLEADSTANQVNINIPGTGWVGSASTGSTPVAIALDPSSQFVYVANSGDGTVSAFNLTLASPYLTPLTGSPYTAGATPSAVITEPYGRYLYVANQASNTISAYSINAVTGALTPISGTFSTVTGPSSLAVSNDGNYLYVTGPTAAELQQFTINSDGTLTSAGGTGLGSATGATSITTIGTYK